MLEFLSMAANTAGQAVSGGSASVQPGQMSAKADFTVVFILISLVVSIALPIVFVLWGKIKLKGSAKQVCAGMLGFVLFKAMLPAIISVILFPRFLDQSASSFEAGVQVVIIVICTELGRFLLLFLSRKKRTEFGNAVTLGSGYCIMEVLIVVVGFLIPYLLVAVGSEGGSIDGLYRELRVFVMSDNLVSGKEWRFLVKGFICIVFGLLQINTSVMMFTAVQKRKYWITILPVLFSLLIMIPNKMSGFEVWHWGNLAVILPYMGIVTVIGCLSAYYFWNTEYKEVPSEPKL